MTAIQVETPVLSIPCNEPEGLFVRHVYKMDLSIENILMFWEKAKAYPTVFGHEVHDFKQFCELFISTDADMTNVWSHGLFWRIDDFVGVFYLTNITAVEAKAHYTFFDKRQKGRERLTFSMVEMAFQRYGFRRLTVELPGYVKPYTEDFVKRLGFKLEGRKRKAVEYNNEWFELKIFGILKEEVI
jgi:hypothetical protein